MVELSSFVVEFLILIILGQFGYGVSDDGGGETMSGDTAKPIVGVCAAVCLLLIIFDIYYIISTMKLEKEYNSTDKELMKLLDDKENVLDAKTMQDRIGEVLTMVPRDTSAEEGGNHDQAKIDLLLKGIADTSGEPTETIQGARDNGTLPIKKINRVVLKGRSSCNLHISRLHDLYGNPVFLSAAPLPVQFADQWEAIWQNDIGLVVWVGRLAAYQHHMDAYIALKQGDQVKYGDFTITTMESGDYIYRFAIYMVKVQRGRIAREIIVMHAYEWMQECATWALQRDVDVILCMKEEHCRRMRLSGRRGVLIQCKYGTAGSATLFSVYLGFQFWLREKRVNLYGILKYVRRVRPMAFEQTGDPSYKFFDQIQIVYSVMFEVVKFCATQKLPMYDKWVMDKLKMPSPSVDVKAKSK